MANPTGVAEGPAGIPVSWDAEVTKYVRNKLLAWRSLPGSAVQTEGVVRFDSQGGPMRSILLKLWPTIGPFDFRFIAVTYKQLAETI
jgi:uncharacterized membrane protein